MDISWAEEHLGDDNSEVKQRLHRVQQSLSAGVDLKRRIIEELRPTLLDEVGLFAALRWQMKETCGQAGLKCIESYPNEEPAFTSEAAIALFRVAQEAFTNILKHSQAKWAKITMACDDHELEIIVSDNGVGFSPGCSDTNSSSRADGFCNGLDNMHRRLTEIGGQCRVESKPDHGTIVRFTLSFHGQATVKANQ